jgi:MoaA/NifB/PqqE/SkfB family radical SAM enzyme
LRTVEVLHAWKNILIGRAPSVSIEITRECPLRCPGCYAYEDNHLGGEVTLRQLSDRKGDALVSGILGVIDELKPQHVSLVGGDPLVRYRELDIVVPKILERGTHVQLVTSAFRQLNPSFIGLPHFNIVVSIDGLQPEHDQRRTPATYDRILTSIKGHQITVHCTVTSQMMDRPGYLDEFMQFWSAQREVRKIWFSIFTPQRGATDPEILSPSQRAEVVRELLRFRRVYPKLDMPEGMIMQFAHAPASPDQCVFAQTTETISADLTTRISPCQFGGDPDCSQCGCIASMGLAAVAAHKLGGFIPVGTIFRTSVKIGTMVSGKKKRASTVREEPLKILQ